MWRYIWLIISYVTISCLPLLTHIGRNFEYEYSLAVSLLALIILPCMAIFFPQRYIPVRGAKFHPPIAFESMWILFFSPLVLFLPGVIAHATALCSCSQTGFYFWMFVQTLPCWILAHAFHHFLLKIRHDGLNRAQAFAVQVCIWALVSITVVAVLWFFPQKRLVSVFVGFIHGPIYDNWIPVDHGIFYARMAHLFTACTLLTLAWFRRRKMHYVAVICFAIISMGLYGLSWSYKSVGNGSRVLNRNFTDQYQHGRLTFHFVRQDTDERVSGSVKRLFKDSVFHYEDLSRILGVDRPPVDIYLYPSQDKKKLWFGGGSTDVTDVVTPSVHITQSYWPHPTLRHELVHALSSYFAFYGLGFHPNMALTEGLAVALAPDMGGLGLDEASAALLKQKRLPDLDNLFSFMFWKEAGARAYTVSGSIINFITREKGFRAVKELYSGSSWQDAIGESRTATIRKWLAHIRAVASRLPESLEAERLYRYVGLAKDLCPHSKADLFQPRDSNIYTRLRQPVGWDPKNDYLIWRSKLEPDNRGIQFRLWRDQIAEEATRRVIRKARLVTWAETLDRSRSLPPRKIEDIEKALIQSDLQRLIYGADNGIEVLKEALNYVRVETVGRGVVRQFQVRLMLDRELRLTDSTAWHKYLAGWAPIPKQTTIEEPWIVVYLRLRNGRGLDRSYIEEARKRNPPKETSDLFLLEWYKFLGHRQYQAQMYDNAATAYSEALRYADSSEKASLELWVRKSRYFSEKRRNI